jgi:hypothetical protein
MNCQICNLHTRFALMPRLRPTIVEITVVSGTTGSSERGVYAGAGVAASTFAE